MKAAVLEKLETLVVKEVETPVCDDNSMLVKVKACAICGSDLRIFGSGNDRVKFPAIMGHEIAGEVVAAGKYVEKFQAGDRVAIGADVPCGVCDVCEDGNGNNCAVNYAIGYQIKGGFAEYILLNQMVIQHGPVHKIPEGISYDEAALAEPLGCVLNALEKSPVYLGDNVVLIGCGPIGGMMIPVMKAMGANKVIVVQRSQNRQKLAMEYGADVVISSTEEDVLARVMAETGQRGADLVITANSSKETHQQAIELAGNRGRVNLFGGLPISDCNVKMNTNLIHYKELSVVGSHGATPKHHRKALELIGNKRINMKNYISGTYPLDEIKTGFEVSKSRQGKRIIINP